MARAQQEARFAEVTPAQLVCSGNVAAIVWIAGVESDIRNGADNSHVVTVLWILRSC